MFQFCKTNSIRRSLEIVISTLTLLLSSSSFASPPPFTTVANACADCPNPNLIDKIIVNSGETFRGRIVGQNNDFYVIYRFGEYRRIDNKDVKAVQWGEGKKPESLKQATQITLKSGQTFSGVIKTDNKEPSYIILTLPELNRNIVIFKSTIDKEYAPTQPTSSPQRL